MCIYIYIINKFLIKKKSVLYIKHVREIKKNIRFRTSFMNLYVKREKEEN